jgi:hypothetical protein
MKDEPNRGAQPMHRNRRPSAAILLSLVSLMAAFACMQNVESGAGEARDGVAGIEGEGDLPLPVTEHA